LSQPRNVGILIFNDVELLDFTGPFEVFSVTGRQDKPKPFNVYTAAEKSDAITTRNGLSVNPQYTIQNCPQPDILLIPGGQGTRREMNNPTLINWIKACSQKAELVLSVCTGALLLAKAGLLEGLTATTHHTAVELLKEIAPNTTIQADKRFVDNGKIILSSGVATGIDMSLYVVARLLGKEQALHTAQYIEYERKPEL
jgi:transcriptional regulator GlxA family with amidase domain